MKAATYLYRYQPAIVHAQLQKATKGTVWMPRDIFISALRGRAWALTDLQGRTYYPMAAVQDVSDALDAIAQLPGQMLYRGEHLWLPVPSGSPGQYLRYVDDENAPQWADTGVGNYLTFPVITGWNAPTNYNVNSTSYISRGELRFDIDYDEFSFTHFRLVCRGNSTQAGQTVQCQLAKASAPATPMDATGNSITLTSTQGRHTTAWLPVDKSISGLTEFGWMLKGSNTTVDAEFVKAEMHFRIQ